MVPVLHRKTKQMRGSVRVPFASRDNLNLARTVTLKVNRQQQWLNNLPLNYTNFCEACFILLPSWDSGTILWFIHGDSFERVISANTELVRGARRCPVASCNQVGNSQQSRKCNWLKRESQLSWVVDYDPSSLDNWLSKYSWSGESSPILIDLCSA